MRVTDPAIVNALANQPDVSEGIKIGAIWTDQFMDFGPVVENERNVTLMDGGFCAMFVFSAPGVYECHIMALPEYRGGFAFEAGRRMLDFMRGHGARMVWGQPSIHNRAAICYIRRMGLKPAGFAHIPVMGDVQYFVKDL